MQHASYMPDILLMYYRMIQTLTCKNFFYSYVNGEKPLGHHLLVKKNRSFSLLYS